MKFMLLHIAIKEDSFKDVLDIQNNFDFKYYEEVKYRKCVSPYQPPSYISKPRKRVPLFLLFLFDF